MIFRAVEDADLILKARKGDVEAFNLLISRWEKRVFNYLLRILQNREDALDLSQDVFLKAAAQVLQMRNTQPVRFYIIGGPIYQTRGSQFDAAELQEMARQLGVDRSLGLIGFQSDIVPAFRALDMVVHASTAPEPQAHSRSSARESIAFAAVPNAIARAGLLTCMLGPPNQIVENLAEAGPIAP